MAGYPLVPAITLLIPALFTLALLPSLEADDKPVSSRKCLNDINGTIYHFSEKALNSNRVIRLSTCNNKVRAAKLSNSMT